jgi:metal-sulfur cluster biosynthetic enzyme
MRISRPARRKRRATIARSSRNELSANVSSRRSTTRSLWVARARERARRRVPRVAMSSSPEQRRRAGCSENSTMSRNLYDGRGYTQPMPTLEEVEDALSNVIDPELGLDFVELGLIYGVEIDAGHVHVTFTLTTPACPIGPQVTEQIDEFVSELDGVDEVSSSMVFMPPWTPEKMSEDAKFALGY